ncbi:MAG: metallophosphoesterase [Nanoarchaeota archaeon]|nr:metallophosphoesterase [Nanoarchaeota archaeon]
MITIAHISDLHCSKTGFRPKRLATCVKEVNRLRPDAVVVTGDLTLNGYRKEYEIARKYLSALKPKTLIVPGNHDARLCGYEYFDEFFGHGNNSLDLDGVHIIGVDTTVPDLDEGNIGRGKLRWLVGELCKRPRSHLRVVAMHHHLIPVPNTGRERSSIANAGTVLDALIKEGVDMVLCGHRHTPHSWIVDSLVIVNAGSPSAVKLRANIPNSYNIIRIDDGSIEISIKEMGGKERAVAHYVTSSSEKGLVVSRRR